jgi:glycosyltransferase involved in cell wall biosynthesis
VGYSGNLGRAHEFTTLLDAATQLRNHQDIMFLCIGGGAGMTRLQEQVGERQLTNVLFKSYQPRVMLDQSLGVADVHLVILRPELEGLIVPSKFYGIAAAGKPTLFIGDNAGEIARLLVENRIGLTVKTGKANELVKTILAFKSQPELGRDMGARARRLFEQEFTASKAFAKWQVLLKSMDNKMGA